MRSRFPRNSGRFILALMIFGAVLGIRLAPWAPDEPVVDDSPVGVVRVPQLRFRDPAALEAAVPKQRRDDGDRAAHHAAARRPPRAAHLGPRARTGQLSTVDSRRSQTLRPER